MREFTNLTGYDVKYGINEKGVVRNSASQEPLKTTKDESGRNMVSLMKNGKRELVYVDELVVERWSTEQYETDTPIIAHINGNMGDDKCSNLVVTVSEDYRQPISELITPQSYYILYNEDTGDHITFYGSSYTGARVYLNKDAVRYNASSGRPLKYGPYAGCKIRSVDRSEFIKPFIYQDPSDPSNNNNIPPYVPR